VLRLDAGAGERLLDDDGAEVGGGGVGEGAAEFADGRAHGAGDDDFLGH